MRVSVSCPIVCARCRMAVADTQRVMTIRGHLTIHLQAILTRPLPPDDTYAVYVSHCTAVNGSMHAMDLDKLFEEHNALTKTTIPLCWPCSTNSPVVTRDGKLG